MIACPQCAAPVDRRFDAGSHIVTCAACRAEFRLVAGRLERVQSRALPESGGDPEMVHELRVRMSDVGTVGAPFRARGVEGHVSLSRPGDEMSLVYAPGERQRGVERPLAQIVNHTTGQSFQLESSRKPRRISFGSAVAAWVVGGAGVLVAGTLVGSAVAVAGGFVGTLGGLALMARSAERRSREVPRLAPGAAERLRPAQPLVERLRQFQDGRDAARRALASRTATRERLRALQRKMQAVGRESYAVRLDAVSRAIELLSRQIDVDRKLAAEYDRAVSMVEIEIETGTVADALLAGAPAELVAQQAELELLREERAEVERLVAANEEVARLLGPGAAGAAAP